MGRYRAEWGNDGRLWGTFQPSCVFNGLVDGFAEILILFGGSIVANIAAVLVVVGFGYAAAFQELFRPEFPALSRPDGTGDGKHHVTDAKVLFRAHDDLPFGGFQVQEVHEVAARQILELVVVAHLVNEQAQGEVNGIHPCGGLLQQACTVHGLPPFTRLMSEMMLPAIPCRRSTSTSRNTGLKHQTQKFRSRSCCHSLYDRFACA